MIYVHTHTQATINADKIIYDLRLILCAFDCCFFFRAKIVNNCWSSACLVRFILFNYFVIFSTFNQMPVACYPFFTTIEWQFVTYPFRNCGRYILRCIAINDSIPFASRIRDLIENTQRERKKQPTSEKIKPEIELKQIELDSVDANYLAAPMWADWLLKHDK